MMTVQILRRNWMPLQKKEAVSAESKQRTDYPMKRVVQHRQTIEGLFTCASEKIVSAVPVLIIFYKRMRPAACEVENNTILSIFLRY